MHTMADVSKTADVERVCHEEQLQVWADEVIQSLNAGGYLRDDMTYDEVIGVARTLAGEIKNIVAVAFALKDQTP